MSTAPFKKPAGVMNSAFDTKQPRDVLDLSKVTIRSGVPVPPPGNPGVKSLYKQLFAMLKKGDMVELPKRNATGAMSYAKKNGIAAERRPLPNGMYGVWRT